MKPSVWTSFGRLGPGGRGGAEDSVICRSDGGRRQSPAGRPTSQRFCRPPGVASLCKASRKEVPMAWKTSILVVANQTADSEELLEALRLRSEQASVEYTLLLPARPGYGREKSRERLREAVDRLRASGVEAQGVIGDEDPVAAVKEVWDPGKFDEIIVSTFPTGNSKWIQIDLPHRVERMTGVPVKHVVAGARTASA